jgi:hypothetical protein
LAEKSSIINGPGSDISRAIQGRQVVGLQGNGKTQASKRAPLLDTALGKERVNNNTVLTEQQKRRITVGEGEDTPKQLELVFAINSLKHRVTEQSVEGIAKVNMNGDMGVWVGLDRGLDSLKSTFNTTRHPNADLLIQ